MSENLHEISLQYVYVTLKLVLCGVLQPSPDGRKRQRVGGSENEDIEATSPSSCFRIARNRKIEKTLSRIL